MSEEPTEWWRTSHSIVEIAEEMERVLNERSVYERLFKEASIANEELTLRLEESDRRLQSADRGQGQRTAELAVKEKLIRDEFERKVQALQLEFKQTRFQLEQQIKHERGRFTQQIETLQKQVVRLKSLQSACICRTQIGDRIRVKDEPLKDPWADCYGPARLR
jgi:hypothetical protein